VDGGLAICICANGSIEGGCRSCATCAVTRTRASRSSSGWRAGAGAKEKALRLDLGSGGAGWADKGMEDRGFAGAGG